MAHPREDHTRLDAAEADHTTHNESTKRRAGRSGGGRDQGEDSGVSCLAY